ncbi:hypothetical protein LZ554_004658 [Drepanopeziza brunnea f. sp. 'monogermtubi']|nr:hypothetical protein LZ554_004658 [Drepanopeziza brunnea f. sp. 'monogermtubi']
MGGPRAGKRGLGTGTGTGSGGCLNEFWDVLRCKFPGVREVWILEERAEGRVLREDICASWAGSEQRLGSGSGSGNEDWREDLEGKWTAGFEVKVAEAAEALETKTGWVAPPWRLLRADADGHDLGSEEEGGGEWGYESESEGKGMRRWLSRR